MELWLLIIIIVLSCLVGSYLLFFLIFFGISFNFRRRLRIKENGLVLILAQKINMLDKLVDVFKSENIELTSATSELKQSADLLGKTAKSIEEKFELLNLVNKAYNSLTYEAVSNKNIKSNERYLLLKPAIQEVENDYLKEIALYNADVVGYNYWINLLFYRHVFSMIGFKKREIII